MGVHDQICLHNHDSDDSVECSGPVRTVSDPCARGELVLAVPAGDRLPSGDNIDSGP